MWLVGKIHNKLRPAVGIRGPEIYEDEKRFFKELEGKPVYYEHDETKRVGEVMQVWESQRYGGQILASVKVYDAALFAGLTTLKHNGLSIGQMARIDPKTGIRQGKSTPVELSIVKEGAVPHSRVVCFGFYNLGYESQSGKRELMSEKEIAFSAAESGSGVEDLESLRRDALKWRQMREAEDAQLLKDGGSYVETLKELGMLTPDIVHDFEEMIRAGTFKPMVNILKVSASKARDFSELQQKFEKTQAELQEKVTLKSPPEIGFTTGNASAADGAITLLKRLQNEMSEGGGSKRQRLTSTTIEEEKKLLLSQLQGC